MMAADYNKPVTTDDYADILTQLRDNIAAAQNMLNDLTGVTNIPTGALRYDQTAKKLQVFNGTTFVDSVLSAAGGGTGNSTGTAATATKLATARAIGGVNFDGTANINLPGVNTTGNQNTTGSAAKLTTARTITLSGDVSGSTSFDGASGVTINTTVSNDSHSHGLGTLPNFRYGTVSVDGNSNRSINLGGSVVTAMACQATLDDYNSGGVGVTWSGSSITIRNSYGNVLSITYWAWVS